MTIGNLYIVRNGVSKPLVVAENVEEKEAYRIMVEHLNARGIRPYYYRKWMQGENVWTDYGSWSTYYVWGIIDDNNEGKDQAGNKQSNNQQISEGVSGEEDETSGAKAREESTEENEDLGGGLRGNSEPWEVPKYRKPE